MAQGWLSLAARARFLAPQVSFNADCRPRQEAYLHTFTPVLEFPPCILPLSAHIEPQPVQLKLPGSKIQVLTVNEARSLDLASPCVSLPMLVSKPLL